MAQTWKTKVMDVAVDGARRWLGRQFDTNEEGDAGFLAKQASAVLDNPGTREQAVELFTEATDHVVDHMKMDTVRYVKEKGAQLTPAHETYQYIRDSLIKPDDGLFMRFGKSIFAGILWLGSRMTTLVVATHVDRLAQQYGSTKDEHYPHYLYRIFNKWCVDLFGQTQQPAPA